jgi:hypothetical protein
MRDNAIGHCAFSSFRVMNGPEWCGFGLMFDRELASAAVVAAFAGRLPGNGCEGALEEGVVDDVAFVIFAFDDPVAGVGFALAGVGEDDGGIGALGGVYEKGSAGAKRVHETLRSVPCVLPTKYISTACA